MPATRLDEVTDRVALERFVRENRETDKLEYKRLRDLVSCRNCEYCRRAVGSNDRDQDPRWAGVVIARAVASMANGSGGWVVLGVRRSDESAGLHSLEESACENLTYSPEMILTAVREHTVPVVPVEVSPVLGEGPPAYLVRVRATMKLEAWTDPSGCQHLYHRHEASSVPLDVTEIEFFVRTKLSVDANRELREELLGQIWILFDSVLGRPAARTPETEELTYDRILALDPYGVSHIRPTRRTLPKPPLERAVLEMPSQMAVYGTPRDLEHVVENLSTVADDLAHGSLDPTEHRLIAAARWLKGKAKFRERLSPFDILLEFAREDRGLVHDEFMAGYEESFEQVFERLKGKVRSDLWDDRTKKRSISEMADALTFLLPLGYQTLKFYLQLQERYGPEAIGGAD